MSTTYIVSAILIVLVVALPSWVLCRMAKSYPPALTHPVHESHFGGLLYVFVIGQVGMLLTAVWQTSYMTSELFFMPERQAHVMFAAAMAVVPTFLGVVLGAVILWQLVFKRTPKAVAVMLILLWLIGPGTAFLQSWFFQMPLTNLSLIQTIGWCVFWTLYFALSARVALLFGTPRGKRLVAEYAAK